LDKMLAFFALKDRPAAPPALSGGEQQMPPSRAP
jgi:hypothetical protein